MEIDRSYHPLDRDLLAKLYVPGIVGTPDLDALASCRAVRERVFGYASLFKLRAADKVDPNPQPPRLRDRLKALLGNPRAKIHARDGHPGFDPDIYLYGRPYFITEDDPEKIAEMLDRLAEVDAGTLVALFRKQVEYFDVDLADEIASFVERRPPTPLPAEKVRRLFHKILHDRQVALRDALLSVDRPEAVPAGIAAEALEDDPDMEQSTRLDPVERFAHLSANGLGLVLAEVHPFWCHTSGFDLAAIADHLGLADHATSCGFLLEPLYELLPEARSLATAEIRTHYTAGAVISAERVAPLLDRLRGSRDGFVKRAGDAGLDRRPENLWKKLVEAFTYAARKGVGILEAGEVRVAEEGGMP